MPPPNDAYGSLLTPEDRILALSAGLRGFGSSILSQGYTREPRGMFQGLGAGVQGFDQGQDRALDRMVQLRALQRNMGREDRQEARVDTRLGFDKNQDVRAQGRYDTQQADHERVAKATSQLTELANGPRMGNAPFDPYKNDQAVAALMSLDAMGTARALGDRAKPLHGAPGTDFLNPTDFKVLHSVPERGSYQERDVPLPGSQWQRQSSRDHGRGWSPVGEPYSKRQEGLTPSQQARNGDVQAARRSLEGMTREQIVASMQPMTPTGRVNDKYNPFVSRAARIASRKLTGEDDPDHEQLWGKMFPESGTESLPQGGKAPVTSSGNAVALPTAGGAIDRAKLTPNTIYQHPKFGAVRWDGTAFEQAD